MRKTLPRIYAALFKHFGPQHWWPADGPFEVMVGAILTQNTNWGNVEKAIVSLKSAGVLTPRKLDTLSHKERAQLIRSAGYFNVKARRLAAFTRYFMERYEGSASLMAQCDTVRLRKELLAVKGIGPETADSILLYACRKPVFVVDAYTKRIFSRHKLVAENASYDEVQEIFMDGLRRDQKLFNEYHALIVRTAKEFCVKQNPRCKECPLDKNRGKSRCAPA